MSAATEAIDPKTIEALKELESRFDAWQNVFTALGVEGKDPRMASAFILRNERPIEEIYALYGQDAIFARIIDAIPEHATRRWIKVLGTVDDAEQPDEDFGRAVMDELDELEAQHAFYELMRLDRLEGGAAMLIGADDGLKPEEPLDLKRIRKVKHLNVVGRYEIFPGEINRDPTSPQFRQPEYYTFGGIAASVSNNMLERVHHTRVIRLNGIRLNDRLLVTRSGWGLPVIERVYEPVRQFGTLYEYAEAMFKDIVQGVMKIKGLAGMVSVDQGNAKLINRLVTLAKCASAFNMVLIDADGEEYERKTLAVTGVSDIMVRTMDKLAAAAEMPLSILFGQPPTGLSTDDKSGRTTFYDSIGNKQKRTLRRPIKRVIEAVIAAKDGPTKGRIPARWSFEFLPLEEPSEKEDAERRLIEANTDDKYFSMGALTAEEIRSRLSNDPKSPYQIEIDAGPEMNDPMLPEDAQREATGLGLREGITTAPPPKVPSGRPPRTPRY